MFGLSSISFNDFKLAVFVYSFATLVGSRTVAWYASVIGLDVLIFKLDHSIVLLPGFNTPLLLTEPVITEIPTGNWSDITIPVALFMPKFSTRIVYVTSEPTIGLKIFTDLSIEISVTPTTFIITVSSFGGHTPKATFHVNSYVPGITAVICVCGSFSSIMIGVEGPLLKIQLPSSGDTSWPSIKILSNWPTVWSGPAFTLEIEESS